MLIVEFISIVLVEKKSRIDQINSRLFTIIHYSTCYNRYKKDPISCSSQKTRCFHKRINPQANKYSLKCVSILSQRDRYIKRIHFL